MQEALPRIDRLEDPREALAALAITVARTHGRLARYLAQCNGDTLDAIAQSLQLPGG
ncbi:hypothetical protein AB0442_37595 [Kitasatospora sp. NPDC085895]|uniref:hypothetical protein n=1 Tax=Kitasatospora sp. NPDC085895 TaxID=3155057 RepID=UPI00344DA24E